MMHIFGRRKGSWRGLLKTQSVFALVIGGRQLILISQPVMKFVKIADKADRCLAEEAVIPKPNAAVAKAIATF